MKYIVMEIQTDADGNIAKLDWVKDDQPHAESKYYEIMTAAAVSQVPMHAAVVVSSKGQMIMSNYYEHKGR